MSGCSNFIQDPGNPIRCVNCRLKMREHPNSTTSMHNRRHPNQPYVREFEEAEDWNIEPRPDRLNLWHPDDIDELLQPSQAVPTQQQNFRRTIPPTSFDESSRPARRQRMYPSNTASPRSIVLGSTPLQSTISDPTAVQPFGSIPLSQRAPVSNRMPPEPRPFMPEHPTHFLRTTSPRSVIPNTARPRPAFANIPPQRSAFANAPPQRPMTSSSMSERSPVSNIRFQVPVVSSATPQRSAISSSAPPRPATSTAMSQPSALQRLMAPRPAAPATAQQQPAPTRPQRPMPPRSAPLSLVSQSPVVSSPPSQRSLASNTTVQTPVVSAATLQRPGTSNSVSERPTVFHRPPQSSVVSSTTPQRPIPSNMAPQETVVSNTSHQEPAVSNRSAREPAAQNPLQSQPTNLESETHVTRRVLFIGPAGAGKSTIINVLINNEVYAGAMQRPAGTSDTTSGQTAFFTTYYDFPNYAYTDSIGLGDPRFRPEDVMDSLKSVLKMASVGYNKVYICLQYGRIPIDTRKYIELITTVFGKSVLKWSSLIFTRCNDQTMTKANFLEKNSADTDIVDIVNQVNTVIFGDNMVDTDPEMENVLCKRRRDFLHRIRRDLDDTASGEVFRLKKRSMIARVQQMVRILFGSHPKANSILNDIRDFARAVAAAMQSSKYHNYFGECSICLEDVTDENQPIITQCSHVYHETCLLGWIRSNRDSSCPICRTRFDNSQKFYESVAGDA